MIQHIEIQEALLNKQIWCWSRSYFTTDGRSVSMSWCRAHSGTWDQILLPVGRMLPESCGLVSVERPFWREDRSVICIAITQWSESRKTSNNTLLSYLRLPQPGGPGSRIYILQELWGIVIPPGTRFSFDESDNWKHTSLSIAPHTGKVTITCN
jgi:hypothetical protein